MISRFKLLVLFGVVAVACKPAVEPPPSPPSPPPPPNHAPVAVAGGPYNTSSGVITVDGSQSSDADGDALTYAWSFGDGTSGDSATMSHTYQTNGDYNISLVVRDTKGAKDTATTSSTVAVEQTFTLVGAGNVAGGTNASQLTAALIEGLPDATVFTLGDNAFPNGTDSAYATNYAPTWGKFLSRTEPTLGNHEYDASSNAQGAFDYFGDRLRGVGYYSYDVGSWHVIVLNDKGDMDPTFKGVDATQAQWLNADLAAHTNQCTIAMFHVPLFVSSNTPGWTVNPGHKPLFETLYLAGVDIVLNGQQHNYERFAPMDPNGNPTDAGIREFSVGTGGSGLDNFTVSVHPHSEIRSATYGVLKLTLKSGSYDWQFIPVAGSSFTDSGSGTCH